MHRASPAVRGVMAHLITSQQLQSELADVVVVDCRFSLADTEEGRQQYLKGHIPGAHYLHLDEDLSGETGQHGGRHPLPEPQAFCDRLAAIGIARDTPVVAYDASRFAFASRLWWMMGALGFSNVRVLDGGFHAWVNLGGALESSLPDAAAVTAHQAEAYLNLVDFESVREAQQASKLLIDSREAPRYQGLEEPIDPVAGHIPGALNFPWQEATDANGLALSVEAHKQRWASVQDDELVVYCGSGVTACANLLSLAIAGRSDASLYGGSWSDWCSYLESEG